MNKQPKKEKIFADGFSFKRNENSPDFVVGRVSVKTPEAITFLNQHKNASGWVNIDILISKAGQPYMELDTFQPSASNVKPKAKQEDNSPDLPF